MKTLSLISISLLFNLVGFMVARTAHAQSPVGIHDTAVADKVPGRDIAPVVPKKMGETVEGKCSYLHVKPSTQFPGRVRVYADVPVSGNDLKDRGEVLFCGGTIEQCATSQPGFVWVKPANAEVGRMATSTFIPTTHEYVTVLRIPPQSGPESPAACFEEVAVGSFDANGGSYTTRAAGLETFSRARTMQPTAFLNEIKESVENATQRSLPPQSVPFTAYQNVQNLYPWPQNQSAPSQQPQHQYNAAGENYYQAIAQARANAMASQGILDHNIGGAPGIPGVSEGIGMGAETSPQTCFFTGPLLADACARGANGLTYRVRFFNGGQYIGGRY